MCYIRIYKHKTFKDVFDLVVAAFCEIEYTIVCNTCTVFIVSNFIVELKNEQNTKCRIPINRSAFDICFKTIHNV